jgi:hypothetical protein
MKQFTVMLGSSPYSGQDMDTVLGIAQAALEKGHGVTVGGQKEPSVDIAGSRGILARLL